MRTIKVSLIYDIEEHVPIRIEAQGSSLQDLIDDAEYCVDCPEPKRYHNIDNLTVRSYNAVVGMLEGAWKARKDSL